MNKLSGRKEGSAEERDGWVSAAKVVSMLTTTSAREAAASEERQAR